jgi:hypothetical protein
MAGPHGLVREETPSLEKGEVIKTVAIVEKIISSGSAAEGHWSKCEAVPS